MPERKNPEANIIHVNINLTDYQDLLVYHKPEQNIEDHFRSGFHNFVIIDEIQMCAGFERAINSLHTK